MGGKKRIPTGIEEIDKVLAGGISRGSLGAIIGKTGAGKSMFGAGSVPSLPPGLSPGSYVTMCAVCGKDLVDTDREFGLVCSTVCDAEHRLGEESDDTIRFRVKLAMPIQYIKLQVDLGNLALDPAKVEQSVQDFIELDISEEE